MNKIHPLKIQLSIAFLAALFFVPFLGGVHLFDWDEINFAESAREMIATGDFLTVQINFLPFWEKPPLFIWMQVLSMKIFGINEFAARFPNAVCGIITLLVLFNIGKKLRNNLFGVMWVLAYAGSLLPFFYFKSGIIDPWFNLFIFLGVYFLMNFVYPGSEKKYQNVVLSALFAGLAVLTKGPVGFLLVALTGGVYLVIVGFRIQVKFGQVASFLLVFILVGGFWFILQILNGNFEIIKDFVVYQLRLFQTKDAGHGGFFGYHFIVLLFGVFPTSVLALLSFKREYLENARYKLMKTWMIILFGVVLILFSIVKTKIVHYSSLAYFPLSFLAANYVVNSLSEKYTWKTWQSALVITIGTILALPVTALQFIDKYKQEIIAQNWIHDPFAVANLQASGNWKGFEFLIGILFLAAIFLSLFLFKKEQLMKRAVSLWLVTLLFTFSIMIFIVPRIESYSQGALIAFFKSKAGEDVYLKNIYFKSYATYFYGKTKPPENKNFYDENWLLTGNIDKDVYFVTKIHRAKQLEQFNDIVKTGEKNGFVFYKRNATK